MELAADLREEPQVRLTWKSSAEMGVLENVRFERDGCQLAMDFQAVSAPSVPIGESVELALTHSARSTVHLTGRITGWFQNGVRQRYRIALGANATRELGSMLNRRQAVRVTPDAQAPIRASLLLRGRRGLPECVVQDISTGGATVLIPEEKQGSLYDVTAMTLSMRLPNQEPFKLRASVRSRRLAGTAIAYGFQFDPKSDGFEAAHQRIHEYVMTRQMEALRSCRPGWES